MRDARVEQVKATPQIVPVSPGWVSCGYCYAISLGAPPHGQGQPCPVKMLAESRYLALMDAQILSHEASAASHNRTGFAMNDMVAGFKKMTGTDDEDDE